MIRYEKIPTDDTDLNEPENEGPDENEPAEYAGMAHLPFGPHVPPPSATIPEIYVSSDDGLLAPPRAYHSPATEFRPSYSELSRRRKYSSTSTLASDFLSSSMLDPDYLAAPSFSSLHSPDFLAASSHSSPDFFEPPSLSSPVFLAAPSLPSPRSPISALWEEHRRERADSLSYCRGNVTYKDASVNTDCSMFYEGTPLMYQRASPPLPPRASRLSRPLSSPPLPPRASRLSRPSSFIDNLNKIDSSDNVHEAASSHSSPPSLDHSSPQSLEPSSTADLLNPRVEKRVDETPRATTTTTTMSGKKAKFLSALAKVGIKTATRPRRDFHPFVLENSDSN